MGRGGKDYHSLAIVLMKKKTHIHIRIKKNMKMILNGNGQVLEW